MYIIRVRSADVLSVELVDVRLVLRTQIAEVAETLLQLCLEGRAVRALLLQGTL